MSDFDPRRFAADEEHRREDEWAQAGGSESWEARLALRQEQADRACELADDPALRADMAREADAQANVETFLLEREGRWPVDEAA